MKENIQLCTHLSSEEIEKRYKTCKNTRESRRWHCLLLIAQGLSVYEAAKFVRLSGTAAKELLDRYNERGPEAVLDRRSTSHHRRGRPAALTQELFQELAQTIRSQADVRWTGRQVTQWIQEKTGKEHQPQLGCAYLAKIKRLCHPTRRRD